MEEACENGADACKEAMVIYADPTRDTLAGLTIDCEWMMDVRDEAGKPILRFTLVAETPDQEWARRDRI
jgi:hypothetical protein